MLRQVLALKALDNDFGKNGSHIVVELQDVDNKELIRMVAPDISEVIVNHDMIGRLMLQCARTPELAFVLDSMMGFEGSEFYFDTWSELYGKTFYDITCRFDDAIPVGFRSVDGTVYMNPEDDMVYNEGDEILVLAEDDDTYEPNDGSLFAEENNCDDLAGYISRGKEWLKDMSCADPATVDLLLMTGEPLTRVRAKLLQASILATIARCADKEVRSILKRGGRPEELDEVLQVGEIVKQSLQDGGVCDSVTTTLNIYVQTLHKLLTTLHISTILFIPSSNTYYLFYILVCCKTSLPCITVLVKVLSKVSFNHTQFTLLGTILLGICILIRRSSIMCD